MKKVAEELRQIVADVTPLLEQIGKNDPVGIAERPAPKKWSRKEILGHLIDSACNNQQKFVRMMQLGQLEFPRYDQDEWVDLQKWAAADWDNMIVLWSSYNQHIAYLIEHCDPCHYPSNITIDGKGPFTLEFIMPDYVEHFKHHLKQIFPDLEIENKFANVYN